MTWIRNLLQSQRSLAPFPSHIQLCISTYVVGCWSLPCTVLTHKYCRKLTKKRTCTIFLPQKLFGLAYRGLKVKTSGRKEYAWVFEMRLEKQKWLAGIENKGRPDLSLFTKCAIRKLQKHKILHFLSATCIAHLVPKVNFFRAMFLETNLTDNCALSAAVDMHYNLGLRFIELWHIS